MRLVGNNRERADADRFVIWMKEQGYAPATIGRTIERARQFFRAAQRAQLLDANPFEDVKAPLETNPARLYFVGPDEARRLVEACPNGERRLHVALARWGGLRIPSEALALEWAGVDWERQRF